MSCKQCSCSPQKRISSCCTARCCRTIHVQLCLGSPMQHDAKSCQHSCQSQNNTCMSWHGVVCSNETQAAHKANCPCTAYDATFIGFLLTDLALTASLADEYSLECLRASMAVFRLFTNAQLWMALLGKCLNWLRMICPCTTTKRSTAASCMDK